jgi:hypothetical protein
MIDIRQFQIRLGVTVPDDILEAAMAGTESRKIQTIYRKVCHYAS